MEMNVESAEIDNSLQFLAQTPSRIASATVTIQPYHRYPPHMAKFNANESLPYM